MDEAAAPLSAQHLASSERGASSIDQHHRHGGDTEAPVNKPPGSKFHQQKLPAWQPLITAGSVFPLFLVLSLVFVSIGLALLLANASIGEVAIDYTQCQRAFKSPPQLCASQVTRQEFFTNYSVCPCQVDFVLATPMRGMVYAYYALTNFHQNHRKYVKSHDSLQLSGRRSTNLDPDCSPYRKDEATGGWVAPCGLVANSLFNDTFQLIRHLPNSSGLETVPWTSQGISWPADVSRKFGKVMNWNGTVKPPGWSLAEWQRSPEGYSGDEELQVWLSVAALPRFRKLHRRVLHDSGTNYFGGLPAGNYTLMINYSYPVVAFGGSKSFVLSTVGFLGGRNVGLGALSVGVGCLHLVLSFLFAVMHLHAKRSRKYDPYYGIQTKDRRMLEAMTEGISPPKHGSEDDDESYDEQDDGQSARHSET